MLPYSIAMSHEYFLSENLINERTINNTDTKFVGNIIENPNVVVAYKPGYLDAGIGKFGKFAEEAHKTARHDIAIFIPIIENITKQINSVGITLY